MPKFSNVPRVVILKNQKLMNLIKENNAFDDLKKYLPFEEDKKHNFLTKKIW